MLGSRLPQLNAFIYLASKLDDDFYDGLIVTGSLAKKAAIMRVQQDLEKIMEKHEVSYEEFANHLISEEYKEKKKKK